MRNFEHIQSGRQAARHAYIYTHTHTHNENSSISYVEERERERHTDRKESSVGTYLPKPTYLPNIIEREREREKKKVRDAEWERTYRAKRSGVCAVFGANFHLPLSFYLYRSFLASFYYSRRLVGYV